MGKWIKNVLLWLITIFIPVSGIPMKIITSIKQWRPSISTIIMILVLIAFGFQTVRIEGIHIKPHVGPIKLTLVSITGYKEKITNLENQLRNRKIAEDKARSAQIEINKQPTIISRKIAENINEHPSVTNDEITMAVIEYARTHSNSRCVRAERTSVLSGSSDMSITNSTPKGSDTANLAPGFVAIPTADLQHYWETTNDADKMRAYFSELINQGIAVPWSDTNPIPEPTHTPN